MGKVRSMLLIALVLAWTTIGAAADTPTVLTIMSHDSFNISKATIAAFEEANNVTLKIVKSGDAGAAVNQAILSKNNPLADLFFGVDNTFMSRALTADIFEAYDSPRLADIPAELKLDASNRLLPVDFGDVCLNYDKAWFTEHAVAPPQSLDDLTLPAYKGLTVVQNPATSSPGLAFLMATVGAFGEPGYESYWKKMRANDVYVTAGWSDAYYGQYTRAKGGTRPIIVSYASSPPAEVHYSETPLDDAPTAAVLGTGAAFRQIEFVGILKGTKQPELARKLVDFMLSPTFQADIPLNMWVFPAVSNTPLPEVFTKYTQTAQNPVLLTPDAIESGREKWIETWTDIVLR